MAWIGLKYAVFAPISSHTDGAEPTYGTGFVAGKMMTCNVNFNYADASLYADDVELLSDDSITGGTISLGVSDLLDTAKSGMLGMEVADSVYTEKDVNAPYGGFGYTRSGVKDDGTVFYSAYWIYKTKWKLAADDANTKNDSPSYQTPTLDGKLYGIYRDNTGEASFRSHKTFTTEAEAIAWVNTKAGIA